MRENDEADRKANEEAYSRRTDLLARLAKALEEECSRSLEKCARVDRIAFRSKNASSFGKKSVARDKVGVRKYGRPLSEIEDQVAGRVLVFFRRDIAPVVQRLKESFTRVEQVTKAPERHAEFAYESEHLVFIIPPQVRPSGWADLAEPPTTFEMQVRTLFMHAWAEPQHDIEYKASVPLTAEERKKLAWAASSAWGGDAIFEQVLDSIAERAANDEVG